MHPTGHLKVSPGAKPWQYTVTLDGHDISSLVAGATVTFDPRSLPRAELDIVTGEAELEGKTQLVLKPGTADLLKRFGWNPPGTTPSRVFTDKDTATLAHALWWGDTQGSAPGTWFDQPADKQKTYLDKARNALRSLGTLADDTFATVKLGDLVTVPRSVLDDVQPDPTAWRFEPDSTPRPTDEV